MANKTDNARKRIASALRDLPGKHVLTSSFGAQSAVMLHLVVSEAPDIPVVFIDTGYLFSQTYQFADQLRDHLTLNLKVYKPNVSAAWQEARHGRRWEAGIKGIEQYNQENKVEPMHRALDELSVGTWFSGIRRVQSDSRAETPWVQRSGDRFKVHPLLDWSDRDMHRYLKENQLPYHPLWEEGYVSIGDTHTTRSLRDAGSMEETRFFGLKRECGLHEMNFGVVP